MSKTKNAFSHGKAFIPFITAGDPNLSVTEELVYAMAEAGADLIELGIPFSDPMAEGPVIMDADERALAAGTTVDKIFEMVENIRKKCQIPMAFMTYFNPVFFYGTERFMKRAAQCGIDAVIVPDLPFEERQELLSACRANDIDLISMVSPSSHERIRAIAEEAEGFVYCVSSMGVTGMRSEITTDIGEMVKRVKAVKEIPCAIGFGISTPQQAEEMSRQSDGAIVGSAIVKLVGEYGEDCVVPVKNFVREMKNAVRRADLC